MRESERNFLTNKNENRFSDYKFAAPVDKTNMLLDSKSNASAGLKCRSLKGRGHLSCVKGTFLSVKARLLTNKYCTGIF